MEIRKMFRRLLLAFASPLVFSCVLQAQTTSTDRLNGASASLAVKAPVKATTTANITLEGEQTVGGVAVVEGDRVLVKDQTDASENGIYVVNSSEWSRAPDFDGARDAVKGTLVLKPLTTGRGALYQVTTANPITIGTSDIEFILLDDPNVTHPTTTAEVEAAVTPTNTAYPPGDIRRYGASTGIANNATAIQTAIDVYEEGGPAVYIPTGQWPVTSAIALATGVKIYGDGRLSSRLMVNGATKGFTYNIGGALTEAGIVLQDFQIHGTPSALQLVDIEDAILIEFRDMGMRSSSAELVRCSGECDSIKFFGGILESWTTAGINMAGTVNSLWMLYGTQFNVNDDIASSGPAVLVSGPGEILNLQNVNMNGNARPTPLVEFSSSYSRAYLYNCYAEGATTPVVRATGTALVRHLHIDGGNYNTTNSVRVDLANSQAHEGIRINALRTPDTTGSIFDPGASVDFEYEGSVADGSMGHVVGWGAGAERYVSYRSTRTRGQRTLIGPWTVTNLAASQSDAALTGARAVMPRTGSVTGIVVKSNEARTAGTVTIDARVNTGLAGAAGTATGLQAVLDGTNTAKKATTQAPNLDTFAAGDEVYPTYTSTGAWTPVTADVQVYLEVEF
jgi:hypothetical protein